MAATATMVAIEEAEGQLARLMVDVEAGGEVTVTRAGAPVFKLVRAEVVAVSARPRRLGMLEHMGFRWDESAWTEEEQRQLESDFYDGPLFPPGYDENGEPVAKL